MPLIAASSEVDAAADADSSVWCLLVPGTEEQERTEGNNLSLNVYSFGLRRTRYQGEGAIPNPVVAPGYSFRLSRGDSLFCVPRDECPYLTGSVVIFEPQPSSAGTNESLGRDRSWSVVRGAAGLAQVGPHAMGLMEYATDNILSINNAPAQLAQRAEEEEERWEGCPPSWVFRSGLRAVACIHDMSASGNTCIGCTQDKTWHEL